MFQAALTSSYDLSQETILFSDSSDYVANGQPSHLLALFNADSYYSLRIVKPDSSVHTFSNQTGATTAIPSASLNVLDSSLVLGDSDVSGSYTLTLYSVPSWSALQTYSSADSDSVFYLGYLWVCNDVGVTSTPSIGNPDWSVISLTSLGSKYFETDVLTVVKSAPAATGEFYSSLVDSDGILNVTVDSECSHIEIIDSSNYNNAETGHSLSDFSDYRFIRMTKPTGEYYYFSSVDFSDIVVDQVISPADSGNNTFYYQLDPELDKDGVYIFEMCNYPTWNDLSAYEYDANNIVVVFYEGELYKLIADSTNNLPNETNSVYWELYELTDPEDEYNTRYCTCSKIAVLCLNTYKCYQELTRDAFCAISEDFCNDDMLCKNRKLLQVVKLRILIDEIGYAVNRNAWNEVVDIFNLIYKICGCR